MSISFRRLLIPIIIVAAIIAIVVVTKYKTQVVPNDDTYNGTTAGNSYNGSLFCEHNNTIYFANPADNYNLYSMSSSGENLTKLADHKVVSLNVDDNYIYYIQDSESINHDFLSFMNFNNYALFRCDLDGKNEITLDSQPCMYATLIGNYIYYLHYDDETATTLYKVKNDGSKPEVVFDEPIYPCGCSGKFLYYVGSSSDHYIHRLDTTSGNTSLLYMGNYWQPQVSSEYIYFLDNANNYCLCRINMSEGESSYEVLVDEFVENFNVYENVIYYQVHNDNTDESALMRMNVDDKTVSKVATGEYRDICITSEYTYFHDFSNEISTYRTPTKGDISVQIFNP